MFRYTDLTPVFVKALDSAHQLAVTAAIYKFLISDFLDPLLLPDGSPGSGEMYGISPHPPFFSSIPSSSSESSLAIS